MYHNFIPNFIMSNQPILESFEVIKKSGKIERLFSKKLSQDYFKLKENTPMPFPKRGFIIETETAIFYSNTDKAEGEYFKDKSGIREFYTTAGHLLREEVFLYGITQSPTRTLKALRELYPGYQHIFKMKFRSVSSFSRSIIKLRSQLKKFKILLLRLERWTFRNISKLVDIDKLIINKIILLSKKITNLTKTDFQNINSISQLGRLQLLYLKYKRLIYLGIRKIQSNETRITKKIYRIKRKISKLSQKEATKWSKGYIIFYKGIYEDIKDVGKRVSFPKFGVILENRAEITTYNTYGFKQTNKISDCFGRYDTHFMYTVREAKEILQNMHFDDVDNWLDFKVIFEDIKGMNYTTFNTLMTIVIQSIKKEEAKIKKIKKTKKQNRDAMTPPKFFELESIELENLAIDFGIKFKSLEYTFKFNKESLIKKLIVHKHIKSQLETLTIEQLHILAEDEKLEYLDKKTIIEKWNDHIIKNLSKEYNLFKLKNVYQKNT